MGDDIKKNSGDYECFSPNLDKFLREKGFEPYRDYVHRVTGAECNVYKLDDDLSEALTEWSNNKRR